MKTVAKNIVALPVTYLVFTLIFVITNLLYATLYSIFSSTFIAIIPVIAVWSVSHCLYISFLLRKLISSGIYYLISQFLVLGYLACRKVESYLWHSRTFGEDLISMEMQQNILIAELVVTVVGCMIVVYTWKMYYKK